MLYDGGLDLIDSYAWPVNVPTSTVRSGTEELSFYIETKTYNRDKIPHGDFGLPPDFINNINDAIKYLTFDESSGNVQGEIKKLVLKGENKNGKNNKRRFY